MLKTQMIWLSLSPTFDKPNVAFTVAGLVSLAQQLNQSQCLRFSLKQRGDVSWSVPVYQQIGEAIKTKWDTSSDGS
jgi:hypothetical protein